MFYFARRGRQKKKEERMISVDGEYDIVLPGADFSSCTGKRERQKPDVLGSG